MNVHLVQVRSTFTAWLATMHASATSARNKTADAIAMIDGKLGASLFGAADLS